MQPEHTDDRGEFQGKRVLVTRGTKGIGAAVVKRLTDGGAAVVTTARSLPATGPSDHFIQADVSARDGCDRVIKAVLDRLGGLDILINSVGGSTTPSGGALVLTDDHWQQTLGLNLHSAVRLDRGFLPAMLKQGSGSSSTSRRSSERCRYTKPRWPMPLQRQPSATTAKGFPRR
jgi:NAD(P)-dependent dehydrogenase (short-subunit alcohol dehydrogenase family)